jgi:hypothetical protein
MVSGRTLGVKKVPSAFPEYPAPADLESNNRRLADIKPNQQAFWRTIAAISSSH